MNNTPSSATLGLKLDNSDGAAHFTARSLAFYAEDEWLATNRLNIVGGLRLDLLGLTVEAGYKPGDPGELARHQHGERADEHSAVVAAHRLQLGRHGRPVESAARRHGRLRREPGVRVAQQPVRQLGRQRIRQPRVHERHHRAGHAERRTTPRRPTARAAPAPPAVTVNTIDPNLKFPSTWRSSIGYDRRLPWNMIGTVEAMYTRQVQNFYYRTSAWSRIRSATTSTAARSTATSRAQRRTRSRRARAGVTGDVINIGNQSTHDYAYSLTEQLVKRFSNNFEGSAAYTYSRSYDVWDVTSSVAFSNWQFGRSLLRPPGCAGARAVEVGCAAPLRRQRRIHAADQDGRLAHLDRRVGRSVRVRLRQRHERRQLGVERSALRAEERPRHDADPLHRTNGNASRRRSRRICSRRSSAATPASIRSAARSCSATAAARRGTRS